MVEAVAGRQIGTAALCGRRCEGALGESKTLSRLPLQLGEPRFSTASDCAGVAPSSSLTSQPANAPNIVLSRAAACGGTGGRSEEKTHNYKI